MIKRIRDWYLTTFNNKELEQQGYEIIQHGDVKSIDNIIDDTEELNGFEPTKVFKLIDIYREVWNVKGGVPLYKTILNKMPKSLKDSLVCWYSPKLQGITNEYLMDGYLSEEGTSILKDLSGNNHDGVIYGMTGEEGNGCMDDDGFLCFDGEDDYVLVNDIDIDYELSIVTKERIYTRSMSWNDGPQDSPTAHAFIVYSGGWSNKVWWRGKGKGITIANGERIIQFQPPNLIVDGELNTINVGTSTNIKNVLALAKTQSAYSVIDEKMTFVFSRHITEAEYTWLFNNALNK